MASQLGQSPLLARLGTKLLDAQRENAGREPDVGNVQLPGGIEGGIARLDWCKIGVLEKGDNKGEAYFMGSGTVLMPEFQGTPNGQMKVRGLLTRIGPKALCDTKDAKGTVTKTFSQNYGWMRDMLYVLGFNIDNLKGTPEQVDAQIMAGIASMSAAARAKAGKPPIYFRFRTWKPDKEVLGQGKAPDTRWYLFKENEKGERSIVTGPDGKPRSWDTEEKAKVANKYAGRDSNVLHIWQGHCDDPGVLPSSAAPAMRDSTPPVSPNGSHASAPPAMPPVQDETPEVTGPEDYPADESAANGDYSAQFDETDDTPALLAKAKAKDQDAQEKLIQMAVARGYSREEAEGADSWDDLMGMIDAGKLPSGDESNSPPEAPEWRPESEQIYLLPNDPKTGKVFRNRNKEPKPIEVEILVVDAKAKTCKVKSLADAGKTVYDKLPWDALQQ